MILTRVMSLPQDTLLALQEAGVEVQLDAPLLKRTWWRAGGPADGLVQCPDLPTLQAVRRIATHTGCPLFVLGNASNLLISDAGVRGLVIRLSHDLAQIQPTPGALKLGGGVKMVVLIGRMLRHQWTGLEFMAGIPGTIGGAVRMNAGTGMGEVVDALIEVQLVLADGQLQVQSASSLDMSYRTAHLPTGSIVATATFRLTEEDPAESRARIDAHLARRRATQPVDQPSCGSTFRNPPGHHAGQLVEAAGLKGFQIGGALVSPLHANFIVNTGEATAADIRQVIEHVQRTVLEQTGVPLQREVHFAGDWSGWE